MKIIYYSLIIILWLAYQVYWWIKAKDVKKTEKVHESVQSRIVRLIVMISAIILLVLQNIPFSILDQRFVPSGFTSFWIGVVLTASGLLFSIWARHHLGANWSQAVTIKQDHQLVTSGPYAYVRHPIYTGLLLALFGTAVAIGKWRGLVAVVLVFAVLFYKLRFEEKLMRAQFVESYETYSRRVSALIPYII